MIKFMVGNLLEAKEDIIAHSCNCQGKFGSGIALQVKDQYPKAYTDYMLHVSGFYNKKELLGKVVISLDNGKYIANMFGQLNYGHDGKRYTSYDALHDALTYVKNQAKTHNKSVALPYKLGSERGGADWDIVCKMIEVIFEDYHVTIYKLGEPCYA